MYFSSVKLSNITRAQVIFNIIIMFSFLKLLINYNIKYLKTKIMLININKYT